MMTTAQSIFPEGEALRNAVRWISRMHGYDLRAIEEACRRFDLTPAEEEFMLRHFHHADTVSTVAAEE
jgi:hypothetical protein